MKKLLSPEQRRALDVYLATGDMYQAAAAGDVSLRTFQRWKAESTFRSYMLAAQDMAMDELAGQYVAGCVESVAYLRSVVKDNNEKTSNRLHAADSLTNGGAKWYEQRSLAQRMQALEQQMGTP